MLATAFILLLLSLPHSYAQYTGAIPQSCVDTCTTYTNIVGECDTAAPTADCTRICAQGNYDLIAMCIVCLYEADNTDPAVINAAVTQYAAGCGAVGWPVRQRPNVTGTGTGAGNPYAGAATSTPGAVPSPSASAKSGAAVLAVPVLLSMVTLGLMVVV